MNAQSTVDAIGLYVGQPVYARDRAAWIAEINERAKDGWTVSTYVVGAGMTETLYNITTVDERGLFFEDQNEHTARDDAETAERYGIEPKSAVEVADMLATAKAKRQAEYEAAQKAREEHAAKVSAWRDTIRDKIPADAKAVLVGYLEIDDCDTMTDYFNTKQGEELFILGFSKHTRDLFPEMRKAARNHAKTAHLADAGPEAEHREKYSMGAGYYLKDANRYSTGWKVEKRSFYGQKNDRAEHIPYGEWCVPVTQGSKPEPAQTSVTADGFTISEHTHTKRGFQMWIVAAGERVTRETFQAWLGKAKARGGWYSRKWGNTPAGFAFKDRADAEAFAEEVSA